MKTLENPNNEQVVERLYAAMETKSFYALKDIFAENAKVIFPYALGTMPAITEGLDNIYELFHGFLKDFSSISFPRKIYSTSDPDLIIVKYNGKLDMVDGNSYKNEYISTVKLEDGKIKDYVEYFNPLILAKALNIKH